MSKAIQVSARLAFAECIGLLAIVENDASICGFAVFTRRQMTGRQ